jgi:hypothetical protein
MAQLASIERRVLQPGKTVMARFVEGRGENPGQWLAQRRTGADVFAHLGQLDERVLTNITQHAAKMPGGIL